MDSSVLGKKLLKRTSGGTKISSSNNFSVPAEDTKPKFFYALSE